MYSLVSSMGNGNFLGVVFSPLLSPVALDFPFLSALVNLIGAYLVMRLEAMATFGTTLDYGVTFFRACFVFAIELALLNAVYLIISIYL